MKIEDLERNTVIKRIVDNIIADDTFKSKCELNFKWIFEDGKVDKDDIPLIINLFLTMYNNHNKVKVSRQNMKSVFMLLISRLLMEFKGNNDLDEELVLHMLEPQIDILLMTITTINCKFPCCGSVPTEDKEEQVINKMKLNKREMQEKMQAKVNKPVTTEEVLIK